MCFSFTFERSQNFFIIKKFAAKEAYETINEKPIKGIPMKISYNTPTKLSLPTSFNKGKLFIKNLDLSVNEENLRQVFASYGKIVNVKVLFFWLKSKSKQLFLVRIYIFWRFCCQTKFNSSP